MICIDDSATRFEVNPGNLEKIPCLCEKQNIFRSNSWKKSKTETKENRAISGLSLIVLLNYLLHCLKNDTEHLTQILNCLIVANSATEVF